MQKSHEAMIGKLQFGNLWALQLRSYRHIDPETSALDGWLFRYLKTAVHQHGHFPKKKENYTKTKGKIKTCLKLETATFSCLFRHPCGRCNMRYRHLTFGGLSGKSPRITPVSYPSKATWNHGETTRQDFKTPFKYPGCQMRFAEKPETMCLWLSKSMPLLT